LIREKGKIPRLASALAVLALAAAAGWAFLAFLANPQWHWRLYAWRAGENGRLDPPPGYSGDWRHWDQSGRLLSLYRYREGRRDGPYQTFDSAGLPLSRGQYEAGLLEGIQIINQESGARTEAPYRRGKREGVERTWFDNGRLAVESPWVDGVQEGSVVFYFEDGSLQASIPFYRGRIEGVQKAWHANGRLQAEETFRNGLKNGPSRFWRDDGGLDMELNYFDDKMDGTQTWFHPNGGKAREINLLQGIPQGSWKEWDENGSLVVDEEYDKGELKRGEGRASRPAGGAPE
jgi:antitoxin component YwqK of YwqJK toxin-antitoxin module